MSLLPHSRLPVMHITFNAYSVMKEFSFSTIFMERFFWVGDFVFHSISPTVGTVLNSVEVKMSKI